MVTLDFHRSDVRCSGAWCEGSTFLLQITTGQERDLN
jgi:hypothetical protein